MGIGEAAQVHADRKYLHPNVACQGAKSSRFVGLDREHERGAAAERNLGVAQTPRLHARIEPRGRRPQTLRIPFHPHVLEIMLAKDHRSAVKIIGVGRHVEWGHHRESWAHLSDERAQHPRQLLVAISPERVGPPSEESVPGSRRCGRRPVRDADHTNAALPEHGREGGTLLPRRHQAHERRLVIA